MSSIQDFVTGYAEPKGINSAVPVGKSAKPVEVKEGHYV
jgi:hypothetical protein